MGVKNYTDADNMVKIFQEMNIPIRGHCVLWSPKVEVQNWATVSKQIFPSYLFLR